MSVNWFLDVATTHAGIVRPALSSLGTTNFSKIWSSESPWYHRSRAGDGDAHTQAWACVTAFMMIQSVWRRLLRNILPALVLPATAAQRLLTRPFFGSRNGLLAYLSLSRGS
jgi:hypothetical protein